jgi:hypothetical protein
MTDLSKAIVPSNNLCILDVLGVLCTLLMCRALERASKERQEHLVEINRLHTLLDMAQRNSTEASLRLEVQQLQREVQAANAEVTRQRQVSDEQVCTHTLSRALSASPPVVRC